MDPEYNPINIREETARALVRGINEIVREAGDGIIPGTYASTFTRNSDEWTEKIDEEEIMSQLGDEDELVGIITQIDIGSEVGYDTLRSTLRQAVDPSVQAMMLRPYHWKVDQEATEETPTVQEYLAGSLPERYMGIGGVQKDLERAAKTIATRDKWRENEEIYTIDINHVMNTVVAPQIDELLGATLSYYRE